MALLPRNPRILLSNDDSIHSTGFGVLEQIARTISDDVWMCAPESEQSASSHSLTIHRPLRLRKLGEKRFAVDGTPTDSVLIAVNHLMKDHPPDLVLSGVNHGRNIAEDVSYSGTVAAAMEANLLGIRSIALSQEFREGNPPAWDVAKRFGPEVVRKTIAAEWPENVLINVNFPAMPADEVRGVRVVPHGRRMIGDQLDMRVDPRGRRYFWIGLARDNADAPPGTDARVLQEGWVTVTPLHLDLSHYPTIDALQTAFD